jgi:hypothetical protein
MPERKSVLSEINSAVTLTAGSILRSSRASRPLRQPDEAVVFHAGVPFLERALEGAACVPLPVRLMHLAVGYSRSPARGSSGRQRGGWARGHRIGKRTPGQTQGQHPPEKASAGRGVPSIRRKHANSPGFSRQGLLPTSRRTPTGNKGHLLPRARG